MSNVYGGYNSTVAATGEELDGILAKVKLAVPATSSDPGEEGLVPAPPAGSEGGNKVLASNMTWLTIGSSSDNDLVVKKYVDDKVSEAVSVSKMTKQIVSALPDPSSASDNVVYLIKDDTASGDDNNVYTEYILITPDSGDPFMEALGTIQTKVEPYILPAASDSELGGVKTGYVTSGKNYPVRVDENGNGYVAVPWEDTDTTYSEATQSTSGLMSAEDKKALDFHTGKNEVTTLANLPVSKRLVTATLSGATTISVASGLTIGQEIYVRCTPTAAFTQAIPSTGSFTSLSGDSFSTTANKAFEMSILKIADSGVMYSIILKEAE